jgi:hypothetical protein
MRVPARQIRELSTSSLSSALRHSPSARRVIAANDICRLFGHLAKTILFPGNLINGKVSILIIFFSLILF